jgi:hypothetical protein
MHQASDISAPKRDDAPLKGRRADATMKRIAQ